MMIVWQQLSKKPGLRKNCYLDEKKFAGHGRFWHEDETEPLTLLGTW